MIESWRWFGPTDPVSLDDIRQTGATNIVSALHHFPIGNVWTLDAIKHHQQLIETSPPGVSPLKWSVVESIPVHEDIKQSKPGYQHYVNNWIASMENLAACGIKTICYNFMPVIDWTRTDLKFKLSTGAYTLRFDHKKIAAFDLFILQRKNAEDDYTTEAINKAHVIFNAMNTQEKQQLSQTILAGLPGKMTNSYKLKDFRRELQNYRKINKENFRENLFSFLSKVLPAAEALDVKLAIHPDDPPFDVFGLPRIICTADDLGLLFKQLPSASNGMTMCVGTYASRADNDILAMVHRFGSRIHFAHLRGVIRDKDEPHTFCESGHLDGDINMVQIIRGLITEEIQQNNKDQKTKKGIFFRPDHGQLMMDDINKTVNPGYSAIGRLKGLAEIRGIIKALSD